MELFELQFSTEDPRLIEMSRLYWELRAGEEKVFEHRLKDIAARFGEKDTDVRALVKVHCRALSTKWICNECGIPKSYVSRNEYKSDNSHRGHIFWTTLEEGTSSWQCPACSLRAERARREEERREQELVNLRHLETLRRRREVIEATFHKTLRREISPAGLSLTDAVYLLSLIKGGGNENYTWIEPIHSIENLTPTRNFDAETVGLLEHDDLIAVDPDSLQSAFDFKGDEIIDYNPLSVSWLLLPGVAAESRVRVVSQLNEMFAARNWLSWWKGEWPAIWRRIAVEESIQYLSYLLERNKLDFSPGAKTREFLLKIVDEYSVAQIYYLFWKVTEKAAADLWRGSVTEEAATERLIHNLEARLETSRSKGWEVYSFERSVYCPRSIISRVFFDTVLGIGEKGFTTRPVDHDFRFYDLVNL